MEQKMEEGRGRGKQKPLLGVGRKELDILREPFALMPRDTVPRPRKSKPLLSPDSRGAHLQASPWSVLGDPATES